MRRRNKRVIILIIFIVIILAAIAGLVFFYFTNKEGWNKVTRTPIAYMEYMGSYMSFDKEGFVISSSPTPPENIPFVMGMDFEYVVVNEKLPIEDNDLFELCIEISESLSDTEIEIDKINMDDNEKIYLYTGEITVELGTRRNLDKKLVHLKRIAELLKSYTAGTLDMSVYKESGEYTFTTKN